MSQLIDGGSHKPRCTTGCKGPFTTRAVSLACAMALVLLAGLSSVASADQAATSKKKAAVGKCPPGATPVVKKSGAKLVVKRNRRGKPSCKALKKSGLRAPATTLELQIGAVADMLRSAADISPKAFAKLEREIGRKRADRLLDVALTAWRKKAGAASTARLRAIASTTESFSEGGAEGSVSFGIEQVEGAQSGFNANASAALKVTRADVEKFSPDLKEKLPAEITGASAKLDVSFADVSDKCPDSKGAVKGKLHGKGKITLTIERSSGPPIEVTLSAEVTATYTAQVAADGKVGAINNVKVQTVFQAGGSGKATQTYRGTRVGSGFGREGILDAKPGQTTAAFERDVKHVDWNRGGDFGPRGGWSFERPLEFSDLRSIDNIKAMIASRTATNLLTLAAVEYLRKVTIDRIEKSPCGYNVFVDITSIGNFGTHRAEGKLYFSLVARGVPNTPNRWKATSPALFSGLSFTSKIEPCVYNEIINTAGIFAIEIELLESGNIKVTWSSDPKSTASVDCPPGDGYDPPPIPGQPGPTLLEATPLTFELPGSGGLQAISGGVSDGASDGFFHSGSLLISRAQ